MKTSLGYLILFLAGLSAAEKNNHCCPGNNTLLAASKLCEGYNVRIVHMECKSRFMVNPLEDLEDDYIIEEGTNNLIFNQNKETVEFGKYCITKIKSEILKEPVEVAIVCFTDNDETDREISYIIKGTCAIISVAFLGLTFVIYCILPDLRDLQGKCMMGAVFSLMIGFANLGALQLFHIPSPLCVIVGYMSYVWLLAYFFWLNVVTYNVYKTSVVAKVTWSEKQQYRAYCCYAWGLPVAMLLLALILQNAPGDHIRPNIINEACFFTTYAAKWAYFFGIVALLLFINLVLFIVSCIKLWYSYSDYAEPKRNSLKYRCKLYLTLFVITGISWIFEIASLAAEGVDEQQKTNNIWLIPDLINGLQGILIFLVLVVCRPRVRRQLAGMVCCCFTLPERWRLHRDNECDADYDDTRLSQTRDNKEGDLERL